MRHLTRVVLLLVFLTSLSFGQHFSIGVKAGVPFTDAFSDKTVTGIDVLQRTFSDSKLYIIGPMIEVHLPLGLSVEADGLYHPLNFASEIRVAPRPTAFRSSNNFSSFEFPILGKYRLSVPVIKPFVEAGPDFRTLAGSFSSYVSQAGFTAGGGVEFRLGKLRIAPEVRYTRWGDDGPPGRGQASLPPSNVNQAAFLVGFSFQPF